MFLWRGVYQALDWDPLLTRLERIVTVLTDALAALITAMTPNQTAFSTGC
jgi:hypothetical protein